MSFRSYDRTVDADGMPGMTLENIARACEGTYVGSEALYRECITGIEIDSRKVSRQGMYPTSTSQSVRWCRKLCMEEKSKALLPDWSNTQDVPIANS